MILEDKNICKNVTGRLTNIKKPESSIITHFHSTETDLHGAKYKKDKKTKNLHSRITSNK